MALLEEKSANKPSLWNQALKVVKGDSSTELVEQFTQEMTLVAEGLCEDQARLRKAVDGLIREADGQRSKHDQDYQDVLRQLDEHQRDTKTRLDDMARRITVLEKSLNKEKKGLFGLGPDLIGRLTILASIVCGTWIIVTILNLFM